eukprot:3803937-Pyramimonas_sp.AAC.1
MLCRRGCYIRQLVRPPAERRALRRGCWVNYGARRPFIITLLGAAFPWELERTSQFTEDSTRTT